MNTVYGKDLQMKSPVKVHRGNATVCLIGWVFVCTEVVGFNFVGFLLVFSYVLVLRQGLNL